MTREWRNWSGSLRFTPRRIAEPRDDDELAAIIREARARGGCVRVVGTGHSSTPLVKTEDVLVSLSRFRELHAHDPATHQATLGAGLTLEAAGEALLGVGLATQNLGDVNVQTVAGAIATGTHGSGRGLPNLAAMLVGGRLVTGTGEVLDWAAEDHPELGRAARVSLGALGILTRLRLQLLPAYRLRRQEWCMPYELAMSRLDGLAAAYRNCDFYWYPRSDLIKIRLHDDPDRPFEPIAGARLVEDRCDWAPRIIAKNRELRFEEMEYALPAEAGPACFEEIRHRVKLVHRKTVGWRILYRFVAPDDAYLSTAHRRETVTISLLQNVGLPYEAYFGDIEPIFRRHGGRPHWGKKHSLAAPELAAIYPAWEAFHAVRRRFDPAGVFLSPALRRYFLEDAP